MFKLTKEYYERKKREYKLSRVIVNGVDKNPKEIKDRSLSIEDVSKANSYGWEALASKWNDNALIETIKYYQSQGLTRSNYPCNTYDEALMYVMLPELLKRFEEYSSGYNKEGDTDGNNTTCNPAGMVGN